MGTVLQIADPPSAAVEVLDPGQVPGWDSKIAALPGNSFFHTVAWARVLGETYGHRPFYFCRRSQDRLVGLLPIMEVSSPWTGHRGVCLPFTDFCDPLGADANGANSLHGEALELGRKRGWRYLEARHSPAHWPGSSRAVGFRAHIVELLDGVERVQRRFDASMKRGIRRAQVSGVGIEISTKPTAMEEFYRLHCRTRQRHGVPPQPCRFFENIARYVIEPGGGFIVLGRCSEQAVAGAVFFQHGPEAIFKFGASDHNYQGFRPNNLVMSSGFEHLIERGASRVHLGRTSLANEGLRRFKLGFGAREETIEYCRYDLRKEAFVTSVDRAESWANMVFRRLPPPLLRTAGALLYPHLS